jgi:hypothetical protein
MKRPTRAELVHLLMRAEITLGNAKNREVWSVGANDTLKAVSSALTAELAATRDANGFPKKSSGQNPDSTS